MISVRLFVMFLFFIWFFIYSMVLTTAMPLPLLEFYPGLQIQIFFTLFNFLSLLCSISLQYSMKLVNSGSSSPFVMMKVSGWTSKMFLFYFS